MKAPVIKSRSAAFMAFFVYRGAVRLCYFGMARCGDCGGQDISIHGKIRNRG